MDLPRYAICIGVLPQVHLCEIGGSANMIDYVFKNENYEIEFGDSF